MNDFDLRKVKLSIRIGCTDFYNGISIKYYLFDECLEIIDEFGEQFNFFNKVSLSNFYKLLNYIKKDKEFQQLGYRKKIKNIEVNPLWIESER